MKPTVAVCGAGRVATLHARAFTSAGASVVAVADPRIEAAHRLAAQHGARAYPDLDHLLRAEQVDVVDIVTPHDVHAEQAIAALQAGSDVFVDKPIATTIDDGQKVVDATRASGRRLGVCHNLLYHPAVQAAQAHLAAGLIGDVQAASGWSLGWLDLAPWDFRRDRSRTGGGAWVDNGPHLIYTLQHLLGPFAALSGLAGTGAPSRLGGEDTAVGIGRLTSGAVAILRISYAYRGSGSHKAWPAGWRQGFEINGSRGSMRITVCPGSRFSYLAEGDEAWTDVEFPDPFSATFDAAINAFLAERGDASRLVATGEDSLRVLALTLGALS